MENLSVNSIHDLINVDFIPSIQEEEIDLSKHKKISFTQLGLWGSAISEMLPAFRTMTSSVSIPGENLFRVVTKNGFGVPKEALYAFKDGTGLTSTFVGGKGFNVARLISAGDRVIPINSVMPPNPMIFAVAVALSTITEKLNEIEKLQKEMFEWLKNQEAAKHDSNLQKLTEIMNDCKYKFDNANFVQRSSGTVDLIEKESLQGIDFIKKEIRKQLSAKELFNFDKDIEKQMKSLKVNLDKYKYYVYIYCFSIYLNVLLDKQFSPEVINAAYEKIDRMKNEYWTFYSEAYDMLSKKSKNSIENSFVRGFGEVQKFLGKTIKDIPLLGDTQIDETLTAWGKSIQSQNNKWIKDNMQRFNDQNLQFVKPFTDNLKSINLLCNSQTAFLLDETGIYIQEKLW